MVNPPYGDKALVRRLVIAAFIVGAALQYYAAPVHGNRVAVAARLTVTASVPPIRKEPTKTPRPTSTSYAMLAASAVDAPTPNAVPMTAVDNNGRFEVFTARVTYYWPALGGTNCYPTNWVKDASHPYGGLCRSMLLGAPWSDWTGVGAACPPSIKLRQRVHVEKLNRSFYCVDRGGAIQDMYDGTKFIDLLLPEMPYWEKPDVIKDRFCPSGCITSPAWILP